MNRRVSIAAIMSIKVNATVKLDVNASKANKDFNWLVAWVNSKPAAYFTYNALHSQT